MATRLENVSNICTITASIAVVVWMGVRFWNDLRSNDQAVAAAVEDITTANITFNIAGLPQKGNSSRTLVEFSDFECPYCARHAKDVFPQIDKNFVEVGTLRYVFYNFPLPIHQLAPKAAEAGECASRQGKFWEFHGRLFERPQLTQSELLSAASLAGLDDKSFGECLDGGGTTAMVSGQVARAKPFGISGTPTFLLGTVEPSGTFLAVRKLVGLTRYEVFKKAINQLPTVIESPRPKKDE